MYATFRCLLPNREYRYQSGSQPSTQEDSCAHYTPTLRTPHRFSTRSRSPHPARARCGSGSLPAAINPVDVAVVAGPLRTLIGLPDPVGLGWDVSGTVIEVGDAVTDLRADDRVAGLLHLFARKPTVGTHADETVLHADAVARVPDGLDLIDAASLPLTSLTAHQAVDLLGPAAGRTLLVTGGAGAVGGHALALARRGGWLVMALARPTDAEFVARAGADLVTEVSDQFDAVLDAGGAGRAGARRGSRRWGLRRFGAVGTGQARAGNRLADRRGAARRRRPR